MKYAIEHGYRFVLNMDADSPPPQVPARLPGRCDPPGDPPVDVLIGSRYVPGGGVEGWGLKRHFMSRGVNLYSRWLLGLKPKDCSGAFRCYRTALLERVDFDCVRSRGYAFQEEILWHLKRAGARFAETPIVFVDRQRAARKSMPAKRSWPCGSSLPSVSAIGPGPGRSGAYGRMTSTPQRIGAALPWGTSSICSLSPRRTPLHVSTSERSGPSALATTSSRRITTLPWRATSKTRSPACTLGSGSENTRRTVAGNGAAAADWIRLALRLRLRLRRASSLSRARPAARSAGGGPPRRRRHPG